MLMIDEAGTIILVNAQVERLFGYSRDELVGRHMDMLVPERSRSRHPMFRESFFTNPRSRPMGAGRDLFGRRRDGSEVPVEIGLNPLITQQGRYVLSSIVDITERKRAEREREELLGQLRTLNADLERRVEARTRELSETLAEREILLQEVHHRVKNNLQVISSLISMQVRALDDPSAKAALGECQNRVLAIALIHEKLYQSEDYALVPFSDYARSLVADVMHASQQGANVAVELAIDDVKLPMDRAIPCGLILNELIVNALRHAFPDGRRGKISVGISLPEEGRMTLDVRDDGVGLRPGFQLSEADSLGLQLVEALVEQLEAELRISTSPGTGFSLAFATGG